MFYSPFRKSPEPEQIPIIYRSIRVQCPAQEVPAEEFRPRLFLRALWHENRDHEVSPAARSMPPEPRRATHCYKRRKGRSHAGSHLRTCTAHSAAQNEPISMIDAYPRRFGGPDGG